MLLMLDSNASMYFCIRSRVSFSTVFIASSSVPGCSHGAVAFAQVYRDGQEAAEKTRVSGVICADEGSDAFTVEQLLQVALSEDVEHGDRHIAAHAQDRKSTRLNSS